MKRPLCPYIYILPTPAHSTLHSLQFFAPNPKLHSRPVLALSLAEIKSDIKSVQIVDPGAPLLPKPVPAVFRPSKTHTQ